MRVIIIITIIIILLILLFRGPKAQKWTYASGEPVSLTSQNVEVIGHLAYIWIMYHELNYFPSVIDFYDEKYCYKLLTTKIH